MPQLSGIYDAAHLQPICKIQENIAVWTLNSWRHFVATYIEPMPAGPASVVDMLTVAGAVTIAANGTITKRALEVLEVNDGEFLHLRWEPLDNVEGLLWQVSGQTRMQARNWHVRVDRSTRSYDPNLAGTTFWILGPNRDMNLEVRNPMGVALAAARFQFYGYRYILDPIDLKSAVADKIQATTPAETLARVVSEEVKTLTRTRPDMDKVRRYLGQTTFVPAEGRAA